ncbi:MAG: type 4a pilus biogenesis protein PilO [Clostridia bacterium]
MPKYNKKGRSAGFKRKERKRSPGIFSTNSGISTVDLIIIVVAAVIIIVSGILLYTNFRTLNRINLEIEEMGRIIDQKQDTLDKLIELGRNEDLLKENYERNLLYLPAEKSELGIIGDVTRLVEANGGVFKSINYREEVAKENNVVDVPFTLRVNSTFEDLNTIVEEFGKTSRLYVIDAITIVETSPGSSILIVDLEMHTYYKNE